jgi:C1A family cysteine protease
VEKFAVRPPPACYTEAGQHRIAVCGTLLSTGKALVLEMKQQLLAREPLLIGVALYESFESQAVAATGVVPMPHVAVEEALGGHEMCVVGFDEGRQAFQVLNSWGPGWGQKGFCWMPYTYFADPSLCLEVSLFCI